MKNWGSYYCLKSQNFWVNENRVIFGSKKLSLLLFGEICR